MFGGLRQELRSRLNLQEQLWLCIEPSYDDSTFSVLCSQERVLTLHWRKARNFWWPDEAAMASELAGLYEQAASCLPSLAEKAA